LIEPAEVPMEQLLRELTPQVLGSIVRRFRDFAAAEDAVQEASLAAAIEWRIVWPVVDLHRRAPPGPDRNRKHK
jgi:predicted RNA polymerase sigma factor